MWTREAPSSSSGKLPNWDTKSPQYPRQLKDEFLRSQWATLSVPQLYRICTELPDHTVLTSAKSAFPRFRPSGPTVKIVLDIFLYGNILPLWQGRRQLLML